MFKEKKRIGRPTYRAALERWGKGGRKNLKKKGRLKLGGLSPNCKV